MQTDNTIRELPAPRVVKRRTGAVPVINVSPLDRRPREYIVGERVRTARRMRGMSPAELARRTGYTDARISRLENGNPRTRLSSLMHLAEILAVNPRYLTGESEDMTWKR